MNHPQQVRAPMIVASLRNAGAQPLDLVPLLALYLGKSMTRSCAEAQEDPLLWCVEAMFLVKPWSCDVESLLLSWYQENYPERNQ